MVEAILGKFGHVIDDLTLTPSPGDQLVFSKKELGRHAEVGEVLDSLDAVIGPSAESAE